MDTGIFLTADPASHQVRQIEGCAKAKAVIQQLWANMGRLHMPSALLPVPTPAKAAQQPQVPLFTPIVAQRPQCAVQVAVAGKACVQVQLPPPPLVPSVAVACAAAAPAVPACVGKGKAVAQVVPQKAMPKTTAAAPLRAQAQQDWIDSRGPSPSVCASPQKEWLGTFGSDTRGPSPTEQRATAP